MDSLALSATSISAASLHRLMQANVPVMIVDIRSIDAFEKGHILHAEHTPWRMIDELNTMGWDKKKLYIVCSCRTSAHDEDLALAALQRSGLHAAVLFGGIDEWQRLNLPLSLIPVRSKFCCGRGCGC